MVKQPPKAAAGYRVYGRVSGRLEPGRSTQAPDFTKSFSKKVKLNNDALAKDLAKAKNIIKNQEAEICDLKADLIFQRMYYEDQHKAHKSRLAAMINVSLNQVKGVVDNFIAMKAELNTSVVNEESYRRFSNEPVLRASSLTQTQSVGPMVQGHSIKQPRISLSRLNASVQNGSGLQNMPAPTAESLRVQQRIDLVAQNGSSGVRRMPVRIPGLCIQKTVPTVERLDVQQPRVSLTRMDLVMQNGTAPVPTVEGLDAQQPRVSLTRMDLVMQNGTAPVPTMERLDAQQPRVSLSRMDLVTQNGTAPVPTVERLDAQQPRVSLSRIDLVAQNDSCVPATPIPAMPLAAGDPTQDAGNVVETMDMFFARVRGEDPLEGSSRNQHRPTRTAKMVCKAALTSPLSSSDEEEEEDDDDEDFIGGSPLSNRTSYAPEDMDITVTNRLSVILQEPSPFFTDCVKLVKDSPSDIQVPSDEMDKTPNSTKTLIIEELSPILSVFRLARKQPRDRPAPTEPQPCSPSETKVTVPREWDAQTNGLPTVQMTRMTPTEILNVSLKMKDELTNACTPDVGNMTMNAGESTETPLASTGQKNKSEKKKSSKVQTKSGSDERRKVPSAKSAPTKHSKVEEKDADWQPSSDNQRLISVKRDRLIKRRVIPDQEEPGLADIGNHRQPTDSDSRALVQGKGPSEQDAEEVNERRPLRRGLPTSYKEPSLNVKMRRT